MVWTGRIWSVALVAGLALGCGEGGGAADGGGGPAGLFAIDPYPSLVNSSPVRISGSKPAGFGVQVDGLERIAASSASSWELELDLAEGDNSFAVAPVDASGSAGTPETVAIALDSIPPSVLSRVPAPGASDVPLSVVVEVELSEPVDCASASASVFAIQGVSGAITCAADTTTLSLRPAALLDASTTYTVTLFSDLADPAGNPLAADVVWQFTTGDAPDTTPPVPPSADNPAPSTPTYSASVLVGGSKEASASVEMQWRVDGNLRQDWLEIVGKTAELSWQHSFALELGQNAFSLRSVDSSGNVSQTSTDFTVQRDANPNAVAPPTVNSVVSPTSVGNQVLSGTKPANTAVYAGGVELAPLDSATSWSALVQLSPGANHYGLVARDGSGNESDPPLAVDIAYNPPGAAPGGAQLSIEFDLRDMWNYVGDEMYFRDVAHGVEINHFGVDVWIEGPITPGEPCYFDTATKQRLHTRYVGTVIHGIHWIGCQNNPGDIPCGGWWNDSNYRGANYMAALIEFGQWAGSTWPLAPGVQRRDPATGEQWAFGIGAGNQPQHPEIHYPWQTTWGEWITRTRMSQTPFVDGVTEATIDSTQAPGQGAALGSWQETRLYTWDLTDHAGQPVQQGPYLVNILIGLDRARNLNLHYTTMLETDRETCWDDPSHDDVGRHRAEGILTLGASQQTLYLHEKALYVPGQFEEVDGCKWADSHYANQRIKCNCNAGDPWPCPETPISDPALIGERVLFMDPAKYPNPLGDGQDFAVKLTYCPSPPCP